MLDQVIVKRDLVVDCFTIPFPLSEALESLVGWFYFLESAWREDYGSICKKGA